MGAYYLSRKEHRAAFLAAVAAGAQVLDARLGRWLTPAVVGEAYTIDLPEAEYPAQAGEWAKAFLEHVYEVGDSPRPSWLQEDWEPYNEYPREEGASNFTAAQHP